MSGVYGDGFDDGVERTRERSHVNLLNTNRQSRPPQTTFSDLDSQEKAVLSKVDRYGFFDQASKAKNEARVNILPAHAFKAVPKLPRKPKAPSKATSSGSVATVSPGDIERLVDAVEERSRRKELERVDKWQRMLVPLDRDAGGNIVRWKWDSSGKGRKLQERVYKGIPDRWRMAAWAAMVEYRSERDTTGSSSRHHAPPSPAALDAEFRRAMDVPSSYDVQIDLDIPRTISGHVLFRTRYGYGQRSLFHVLHCFSMYCDTCGYCQGMGPIAATLLCYFDAAQVYRLMVRLHDAYRMHDIFQPGFPGLLESLYVQELLVKHLMPSVYESLVSRAAGAQDVLIEPVSPIAEKERNLLFLVGYETLHHAVRHLGALQNSTTALGRPLPRRPRRPRPRLCRHHLGASRSAHQSQGRFRKHPVGPERLSHR